MGLGKKIVTWGVLAVFFLQESLPLAQAQGLARLPSPETPAAIFSALNLSPDHGTIETMIPGTGPVIFHIQEAHGSYEVQKNILSILQSLKRDYGVRLVLLEGSSFPLERNLLELDPADPGLTSRLALELAEKNIVTGPELFLLEDAGVEAFGIESAEDYARNGKVFREVLLQREKTAAFTALMNLQIERLTSPYLDRGLRLFLNRLADFEAGLVPLDEWLRALRDEAREVLQVDLENPYFQLEWPMLLRIFTFHKLASAFDRRAFAAERETFLQEAEKYLEASLFEEVKRLLSPEMISHHLSGPGTGLLFERMAAGLPADFNYDAWPHVNRLIGQLILQSELEPRALMEEVEAMQDRIAMRLAKDERAKKIVGLLKGYRLLKRLFALELTPRDYERVIALRGELRPSSVAEKFQALNGEGLVRGVEFQQIEEIDTLYDLAIGFYEGAKGRDRAMFENIAQKLRETGETKAAVITGGFHSGPFQSHFEELGYSYVLISPKISEIKGREDYVKTILSFYTQPLEPQKSSYKEAPYLTTEPADLMKMGINAAGVAGRAASVIRASDAGRNLDLQRIKWFRRARELAAGPARSELREIEVLDKAVQQYEAIRVLREEGSLGSYQAAVSEAAEAGLLPEEMTYEAIAENLRYLGQWSRWDEYAEALLEARGGGRIDDENFLQEMRHALKGMKTLLGEASSAQGKKAIRALRLILESEARDPVLTVEERENTMKEIDLWLLLESGLELHRRAYEQGLISRDYMAEAVRDVVAFTETGGFVAYFAPIASLAVELGVLTRVQAEEKLGQALDAAARMQRWANYEAILSVMVEWKLVRKAAAKKRIRQAAADDLSRYIMEGSVTSMVENSRAFMASSLLDEQDKREVLGLIRSYFNDENQTKAFTAFRIFFESIMVLLPQEILTAEEIREALDIIENSRNMRLFSDAFLEALKYDALSREEVREGLGRLKLVGLHFYAPALAHAVEYGHLDGKEARQRFSEILPQEGWMLEYDGGGSELKADEYGPMLLDAVRLGALTENGLRQGLQVLRANEAWGYFSKVLGLSFKQALSSGRMQAFLNGELDRAQEKGLPALYYLHLSRLVREAGLSAGEKDRLAAQGTELITRIRQANEAAAVHQKMDFEDFARLDSAGLAALQLISEPLAKQVVGNRLDRKYLPLLEEEIRSAARLDAAMVGVLNRFYAGAGKTHVSYPDFLMQLIGSALAFQALGLGAEEFEAQLRQGGTREEISARIGQRMVLEKAAMLDIEIDASKIRDSRVLDEWRMDYFGLLISTRQYWDSREEEYFRAILRFALEGRFRALLDPAHYDEIDLEELDERTAEVVTEIRTHNENLVEQAAAYKIPREALFDPQSLLPPRTLDVRMADVRPVQALREIYQKYRAFIAWEGEDDQASPKRNQALLSQAWQKFFSEGEDAIAGKPGMIKDLAALGGLTQHVQAVMQKFRGRVPEAAADLDSALKNAARIAAGEKITREVSRTEISFWRRLPGQDAFLGNCVGSCTALGSNASAVFEFLLDLGTHYVILSDKATGEVEAYARFFYYFDENGKPGIYVDSIDGSITDAQRKAMLNYLRDFAAKIKIAKSRVKDRTPDTVLAKIGDALTANYFHHSDAEIPASWQARSELRSGGQVMDETEDYDPEEDMPREYGADEIVLWNYKARNDPAQVYERALADAAEEGFISAGSFRQASIQRLEEQGREYYYGMKYARALLEAFQAGWIDRDYFRDHIVDLIENTFSQEPHSKSEKIDVLKMLIESEVKNPVLTVEEREAALGAIDARSGLYEGIYRMAGQYGLISRNFMADFIRESIGEKRPGDLTYFGTIARQAVELGVLKPGEAKKMLSRSLRAAFETENWEVYIEALSVAVEWKMMKQAEAKGKVFEAAGLELNQYSDFDTIETRNGRFLIFIETGFLGGDDKRKLLQQAKKAFDEADEEDKEAAFSLYAESFRSLLGQGVLSADDIRKALKFIESEDSGIFEQVFAKALQYGDFTAGEVQTGLDRLKEERSDFYVEAIGRAYERGYINREAARARVLEYVPVDDWFRELSYGSARPWTAGSMPQPVAAAKLQVLTEDDIQKGLNSIPKKDAWELYFRMLVHSLKNTNLTLGIWQKARELGVPLIYYAEIDRLGGGRPAGELEKLLSNGAAMLDKVSRANAKAEDYQKIDYEKFSGYDSSGLAVLQFISQPLAKQTIDNRVDRGYLPLLAEEITSAARLDDPMIEVLARFYEGPGQAYVSHPDFLMQLIGFALAFQTLGFAAPDLEANLQQGGTRKEIADRTGQLIILKMAESLGINLDTSQIDYVEVLNEWRMDYFGMLISTIRYWNPQVQEYFKAILRFSLEGRFRALFDPAHYGEINLKKLDRNTAEVVRKIRAHNENLAGQAAGYKIPQEALLDPQSFLEPRVLEGRMTEVKPVQVLREIHQKYRAFMNWESTESQVSPKWDEALLSQAWQKFFSGAESEIPRKPGMIKDAAALDRLAQHVQALMEKFRGRVPEAVADLDGVLGEAARIAAGESLTREVGRTELAFWERVPGQDAFLGNCVGSCTSLGTNASAIFEYLLDLGTHYLLLRDAASKQVKGYARFFYYLDENDKPGLYVDSIDGNIMKSYREAALNYLRDFAAKINIPESRVKDRADDAVARKIGDALTAVYYHHSGKRIPASRETRSELREESVEELSEEVSRAVEMAVQQFEVIRDLKSRQERAGVYEAAAAAAVRSGLLPVEELSGKLAEELAALRDRENWVAYAAALVEAQETGAIDGDLLVEGVRTVLGGLKEWRGSNQAVIIAQRTLHRVLEFEIRNPVLTREEREEAYLMLDIPHAYLLEQLQIIPSALERGLISREFAARKTSEFFEFTKQADSAGFYGVLAESAVGLGVADKEETGKKLLEAVSSEAEAGNWRAYLRNLSLAVEWQLISRAEAAGKIKEQAWEKAVSLILRPDETEKAFLAFASTGLLNDEDKDWLLDRLNPELFKPLQSQTPALSYLHAHRARTAGEIYAKVFIEILKQGNLDSRRIREGLKNVYEYGGTKLFGQAFLEALDHDVFSAEEIRTAVDDLKPRGGLLHAPILARAFDRQYVDREYVYGELEAMLPRDGRAALPEGVMEINAGAYGQMLLNAARTGLFTHDELKRGMALLRRFESPEWLFEVLDAALSRALENPRLRDAFFADLEAAGQAGLPAAYYFHLKQLARAAGISPQDVERLGQKAGEMLAKIRLANENAEQYQQMEFGSFAHLDSVGLAALQIISEPLTAQIVSNRIDRGYLPLLEEEVRSAARLEPSFVIVLRDYYRGAGRNFTSFPDYLVQLTGFALAFQSLGIDAETFRELLAQEGGREETAAGMGRKMILEIAEQLGVDVDEAKIANTNILEEWQPDYLGLLVSTQRYWKEGERDYFRAILRFSLEGRFRALFDPGHYGAIDMSELAEPDVSIVRNVREHNEALLAEAARHNIPREALLNPESVLGTQVLTGRTAEVRPVDVLRELHGKYRIFAEWEQEEADISRKWEISFLPQAWQAFFSEGEEKIPARTGMIRDSAALDRLAQHVGELVRNYRGGVPEPVADLDAVLRKAAQLASGQTTTQETGRTEISFWRRMPGRDAFLGNCVGSCTSLGSNASAIFEFLLDLGTHYILLSDEATKEVKGYARFFYYLDENSMPGIYVDSIDGNITDAQRTAMLDYLREFAGRIKIDQNRVKDRESETVQTKIGNALTERYFHHSDASIPASWEARSELRSGEFVDMEEAASREDFLRIVDDWVERVEGIHHFLFYVGERFTRTINYERMTRDQKGLLYRGPRGMTVAEFLWMDLESMYPLILAAGFPLRLELYKEEQGDSERYTLYVSVPEDSDRSELRDGSDSGSSEPMETADVPSDFGSDVFDSLDAEDLRGAAGFTSTHDPVFLQEERRAPADVPSAGEDPAFAAKKEEFEALKKQYESLYRDGANPLLAEAVSILDELFGETGPGTEFPPTEVMREKADALYAAAHEEKNDEKFAAYMALNALLGDAGTLIGEVRRRIEAAERMQDHLDELNFFANLLREDAFEELDLESALELIENAQASVSRARIFLDSKRDYLPPGGAAELAAAIEAVDREAEDRENSDDVQDFREYLETIARAERLGLRFSINLDYEDLLESRKEAAEGLTDITQALLELESAVGVSRIPQAEIARKESALKFLEEKLEITATPILPSYEEMVRARDEASALMKQIENGLREGSLSDPLASAAELENFLKEIQSGLQELRDYFKDDPIASGRLRSDLAALVREIGGAKGLPGMINRLRDEELSRRAVALRKSGQYYDAFLFAATALLAPALNEEGGIADAPLASEILEAAGEALDDMIYLSAEDETVYFANGFYSLWIKEVLARTPEWHGAVKRARALIAEALAAQNTRVAEPKQTLDPGTGMRLPPQELVVLRAFRQMLAFNLEKLRGDIEARSELRDETLNEELVPALAADYMKQQLGEERFSALESKLEGRLAEVLTDYDAALGVVLASADDIKALAEFQEAGETGSVIEAGGIVFAEREEIETGSETAAAALQERDEIISRFQNYLYQYALTGDRAVLPPEPAIPDQILTREAARFRRAMLLKILDGLPEGTQIGIRRLWELARKEPGYESLTLEQVSGDFTDEAARHDASLRNHPGIRITKRGSLWDQIEERRQMIWDVLQAQPRRVTPATLLRLVNKRRSEEGRSGISLSVLERDIANDIGNKPAGRPPLSSSPKLYPRRSELRDAQSSPEEIPDDMDASAMVIPFEILREVIDERGTWPLTADRMYTMLLEELRKRGTAGNMTPGERRLLELLRLAGEEWAVAVVRGAKDDSPYEDLDLLARHAGQDLHQALFNLPGARRLTPEQVDQTFGQLFGPEGREHADEAARVAAALASFAAQLPDHPLPGRNPRVLELASQLQLPQQVIRFMNGMASEAFLGADALEQAARNHPLRLQEAVELIDSSIPVSLGVSSTYMAFALGVINHFNPERGQELRREFADDPLAVAEKMLLPDLNLFALDASGKVSDLFDIYEVTSAEAEAVLTYNRMLYEGRQAEDLPERYGLINALLRNAMVWQILEYSFEGAEYRLDDWIPDALTPDETLRDFEAVHLLPALWFTRLREAGFKAPESRTVREALSAINRLVYDTWTTAGRAVFADPDGGSGLTEVAISGPEDIRPGQIHRLYSLPRDSTDLLMVISVDDSENVVYGFQLKLAPQTTFETFLPGDFRQGRSFAVRAYSLSEFAALNDRDWGGVAYELADAGAQARLSDLLTGRGIRSELRAEDETIAPGVGYAVAMDWLMENGFISWLESGDAGMQALYDRLHGTRISATEGAGALEGIIAEAAAAWSELMINEESDLDAIAAAMEAEMGAIADAIPRAEELSAEEVNLRWGEAFGPRARDLEEVQEPAIFGLITKTPPDRRHTRLITSVEITPDGRYAVSASWDHTLRIWDLASGEQVQVLGAPGNNDRALGHAAPVAGAALTPDGRYAVSGGWDHTVRQWDLESGEQVRVFDTGQEDRIYTVAVSPDGRHAASGSWHHTIHIFNLANGTHAALLGGAENRSAERGHTGAVTALAFTPDGRRLVSGSQDRTIIVWNTETWQPERRLGIPENEVPANGHVDFVSSVAVTPDGRHVVSGSGDHTIRIWDIETGEQVRVIGEVMNRFTLGEGYARKVKVTPGGRYILSAHMNRVIRIWDIETGEQAGVLGESDPGLPGRGHMHAVYDVTVTPNGRRVLSGSQDLTIRSWDIDTRLYDVRRDGPARSELREAPAMPEGEPLFEIETVRAGRKFVFMGRRIPGWGLFGRINAERQYQVQPRPLRPGESGEFILIGILYEDRSGRRHYLGSFKAHRDEEGLKETDIGIHPEFRGLGVVRELFAKAVPRLLEPGMVLEGQLSNPETLLAVSEALLRQKRTPENEQSLTILDDILKSTGRRIPAGEDHADFVRTLSRLVAGLLQYSSLRLTSEDLSGTVIGKLLTSAGLTGLELSARVVRPEGITGDSSLEPYMRGMFRESAPRAAARPELRDPEEMGDDWDAVNLVLPYEVLRSLLEERDEWNWPMAVDRMYTALLQDVRERGTLGDLSPGERRLLELGYRGGQDWLEMAYYRVKEDSPYHDMEVLARHAAQDMHQIRINMPFARQLSAEEVEQRFGKAFGYAGRSEISEAAKQKAGLGFFAEEMPLNTIALDAVEAVNAMSEEMQLSPEMAGVMRGLAGPHSLGAEALLETAASQPDRFRGAIQRILDTSHPSARDGNVYAAFALAVIDYYHPFRAQELRSGFAKDPLAFAERMLLPDVNLLVFDMADAASDLFFIYGVTAADLTALLEYRAQPFRPGAPPAKDSLLDALLRQALVEQIIKYAKTGREHRLDDWAPSPGVPEWTLQNFQPRHWPVTRTLAALRELGFREPTTQKIMDALTGINALFYERIENYRIKRKESPETGEHEKPLTEVTIDDPAEVKPGQIYRFNLNGRQGATVRMVFGVEPENDAVYTFEIFINKASDFNRLIPFHIRNGTAFNVTRGTLSEFVDANKAYWNGVAYELPGEEEQDALLDLLWSQFNRSELRMPTGITLRESNVILETRRTKGGYAISTRPIEAVNTDDPWEVQRYGRDLYNAIAAYAKAISPPGRRLSPQELRVQDEVFHKIAGIETYQKEIQAVMGPRAAEGYVDQLDIYRILGRLRGKRFIPNLPVYPEVIKEPAYHVALLVDPQRSNVDTAILRGLLGNSNIAVDVVVGITPEELRTRLNSSIYGEFLSNEQIRYSDEEGWIEILGKRIRVVKSPSNLTNEEWGETGIDTFIATYDIAGDYEERVAKAVFGSTRLDLARFVAMHDLDLFEFRQPNQSYAGEPYRGKDAVIGSSLVGVPVRLYEALRASRALAKVPYAVDLDYQVSPMVSEAILDQSGKKRAASRNVIPGDPEAQKFIRRSIREALQARTKKQDDVGAVRVSSSPVPVGDRVVFNLSLRDEAAAQFLKNLGIDASKTDWRSEQEEEKIGRAFTTQVAEKLPGPFAVKHERQLVSTDARFEQDILVDTEGVVVALEQADGHRTVRISLPVLFNRELQDVRSFVDVVTEMNRRRNLPARQETPDPRLSAFGRQMDLALKDGTLPPAPLEIPETLGELVKEPVRVGILGPQGQIGSRLATIGFESLNFALVAGSGPTVPAQVDAAQMSSISGPILSNGRETAISSLVYPKPKDGYIGEVRFGEGHPYYLMERYRELTQIPWADHGVEVAIDATGAFVKPEQLVGHLNEGRAEKNGAEAVLLTAPFKGGDGVYPTIVFGVNHDRILEFLKDGKAPKMFSNASCTTNCIALMTQYVNRLPSLFTKHLRDKYGASVTVSPPVLSPSGAVHAPTNSNPLVDLGGDKSAMSTFFYSSGVTKAIKQLGLKNDPWPKAFTGFSFRVGSASTSIAHLPIIFRLEGLDDESRGKLAEKAKEITAELLVIARKEAEEMSREETYRGLIRSASEEEGFTSEVAVGTTGVVLDWQQAQANFRPDVELMSLSLNGFYDNVEQYTVQLARTLDQIVRDLRRVQAGQQEEQKRNAYQEHYETALLKAASFNQVSQQELGLDDEAYHAYQAVIMRLIRSLKPATDIENAEDHIAAFDQAHESLEPLEAASARVKEIRAELELSADSLDQAARSELRETAGEEPVEAVDRIAEMAGSIVPLSVKERFGEETYISIVHRLTIHLKPRTAGPRPLDAGLRQFIETKMPEFSRLLSAAAGSPGRVFGDLFRGGEVLAEGEVTAPLDFMELAPLFILLSQRPELEYTVVLPPEKAEAFRSGLQAFSEENAAKLGFNPLTDLANFHMETAESAPAVKTLVTPSLSQGGVPTAVVAGSSVIDRFNVVNNLARVLLKDPVRHGDILLLVAAALDELTKNSLMVYDEESLRSLAEGYAEELALELAALARFMQAA